MSQLNIMRTAIYLNSPFYTEFGELMNHLWGNFSNNFVSCPLICICMHVCVYIYVSTCTVSH